MVHTYIKKAQRHKVAKAHRELNLLCASVPLCLCAFFLFSVLLFSPRGLHAQNVNVVVDASKPISKINPFIYGLNVARWDEDLFPGPSQDMLLDCDRDAIRKIKDAGFTVLKYPGGNDADHYIWNSPDNSAAEMNTDEYAALLNAVGAQGFITINFNEPPALAADWVRYCNKIKGYNIKYWEVGDEQWGSWARGHTTPEKYAERFIEFAKAMKAVDSTIEIAANVMPSDDPNGWTCRLLKAAGNYIDMVTFSFFPFTNKEENEDSILTGASRYRRAYETIRSALEKTLPTIDSIHGKEKADTMWIADVGYNSISGYPGPITLSMANALYIADMVGTMAQLDEEMSCYWALHNSYPPRGGDFGILSEDGKNTPRNNYYVFPIFTHLFGNELVASSSSPDGTGDSSLSVYSSTIGSDTLSIILINKNKRKTENASIQLNGFEPNGSAGVWIFNAKHKIDRLADLKNVKGSFDEAVPPYSIIVLQLPRKGIVPPPTNLALNARAMASSYAKNGPDFKPSSAVDGKSYTRWASTALWGKENGLDKQWFEIDLGKQQAFDEVVIHWAKGYGIKYKIFVSNDKRIVPKGPLREKQIFEQSNGKGGDEKIDFAPLKARFVKLEGTQGTRAISTYSIYEFEVYNVNEK